jgi:hypothetical protein
MTKHIYLIYFLLLNGFISAQNTFQFDFGGSNSPILKDYIPISPQNTYSKKQGFGWTLPPTGDFHRQNLYRSRDNLTIDGVVGKKLGFKADVPKGNWILTFWTETGKEDSSTQIVKINGKDTPPQYQDFFKPSEPRTGLKSTFRIIHQKLNIGKNGFQLDIDGGEDSVRLLGLVLEKGDTSVFTQKFYENYQYWLNMRGWEWATQKTGLGIFDRYEMALVYLDAYLEFKFNYTPPYLQALLDKARILYWTDKEVHWDSHKKQAQSIFKRLEHDEPKAFYKMYLGEKFKTKCACDSLKVSERAPNWSKAQLEAHCRLKQLADWWILERQAENGEFGGKIDDDVELLRCLTPLVLRGDKIAIQGWTKLANGVWQSPQMDNGFLKRIRDVEHAAEYFSDTGPMMALLSDDTTFTNRLKPTNQFFKNVWTGTTTNGNRLFKSAWLSSTAFDSESPRNRDLPFSCLAVKPMRYLAWKTGDTATIKLLHEWSKTWRNLALRTDKGKPKGIIPPSVRFPDEAINGDEKTWYQTNMFWHYFEWDYGTYWHMYDQLLFTAQVTGDTSLLEPLFETLNLIKKHQNILNLDKSGTEGGIKGSETWAVRNLVKETGFWTVVSAWRFWSNDSRFDDLLLKYGSPYTRFRLSGDETDLAHGYDKMLQHLRYNFPMVTSEALFTDRVYLTDDDEYDPADYARALLTGDEIQISASPYPSITWTDLPDDLTVLVSESTPKSLKIKLFLHGNDAKNASLRLWGLEKGQYNITIDMHTEILDVKERGQDFSISVEPQRLKELIILKK